MKGLFTGLMITIDRGQARARGWKRYFTGKSCDRGHLAWRQVGSGCMACKREYSRQRYAGNLPAAREARARRYWRDPQRAREASRADYLRNPAPVQAAVATARTRTAGTIPPWYEDARVRLVYLAAREWGMEVDHVVPLKHPLVCGLHCWANLQLLTRGENSAKGNREWPDMP